MLTMSLSIIVGCVIGGVIVYQRVNNEYARAREIMRNNCHERIRGLRITWEIALVQVSADRDHYHTMLRAWYEYAGRLDEENNGLRETIERYRTGTVEQFEVHNAQLMSAFTAHMRDRRATPMMNPLVDNYETGKHHRKDGNGQPVFDEPDGVTVTPDVDIHGSPRFDHKKAHVREFPEGCGVDNCVICEGDDIYDVDDIIGDPVGIIPDDASDIAPYDQDKDGDDNG